MAHDNVHKNTVTKPAHPSEQMGGNKH